MATRPLVSNPTMLQLMKQGAEVRVHGLVLQGRPRDGVIMVSWRTADQPGYPLTYCGLSRALQDAPWPAHSLRD